MPYENDPLTLPDLLDYRTPEEATEPVYSELYAASSRRMIRGFLASLVDGAMPEHKTFLEAEIAELDARKVGEHVA